MYVLFTSNCVPQIIQYVVSCILTENPEIVQIQAINIFMAG